MQKISTEHLCLFKGLGRSICQILVGQEFLFAVPRVVLFGPHGRRQRSWETERLPVTRNVVYEASFQII